MTDEEDKRPPSILSAIRRAQAQQRGTGEAGQPSESSDRAREVVEPARGGDGPPRPPSPPHADDAANAANQTEPFDVDPAQLEAATDVSDTRRRFELGRIDVERLGLIHVISRVVSRGGTWR